MAKHRPNVRLSGNVAACREAVVFAFVLQIGNQRTSAHPARAAICEVNQKLGQLKIAVGRTALYDWAARHAKGGVDALHDRPLKPGKIRPSAFLTMDPE